MLMMVAAINANRLIVNVDAQFIESDQYNHAIALGEALLGEVRARAKFDHNARDTEVLTPAGFSSVLGPEAGPEIDSVGARDSVVANGGTTDYRSEKFYNDVDDYNGYLRIVQVPNEAVYRLTARVVYLSESDFSTELSLQTYLKKIDVTVRNQSNSSAVSLSSIMTYQ
jgi:hypothetical protein